MRKLWKNELLILEQDLNKEEKKCTSNRQRWLRNWALSQTYLSNIEGGKANCSITLLVDICNYLNVTPDYLMLGNMRGNKASIDIIDALKMCDPEELATIRKIVDAFVMKKAEPY